MAHANTSANWIIVKGLVYAPWYEIYVWSYYWAVNIMLTVGFGDLSATNYKEAIWLIFIETIICLVLAYNISCVGTLISKGSKISRKRANTKSSETWQRKTIFLKNYR